jgi:ATP-dependent Lhr-like helicase
VTGGWSLVPPADPDPTRRLHALARSLLDRYGILIRGTVAAERVPGGFAAIYPVLRAMEDAGQCRRGYFVEGLGAAQFALPGAVDRMRAMAAESDGTPDRPVGLATAGQLAGVAPASPGLVNGDNGGRRGPGPGEFPVPGPGEFPAPGPGGFPAPGPGGFAVSGPGGGFPVSGGAGFPVPGSGAPAGDGPAIQPVVLAAADPANPFGAALPWPGRPDETPGGHRPGRKAGSLVVLAGGHLVLYVERGGKTLLSWTEDEQVLKEAATALSGAVAAGALGRMVVQKADGASVHESTPLSAALQAAGFAATPRGLRLRG